ncbi:hypothetical protein Clacol_001687 [Clathrus columnatus]|uniref:Phenylalanine--tRNA ligase beta subunit n=1 Tax=Clathrus columnatus TaxID=1419009 RepID=A0AAV4ZZU5_9AGAM|nr:hypothetical protein Clacol_001687 [Clathrus columnatus]
MPTIAVDKADLYDRLGYQYTTEEFDQLCFDFGIELDEDTTNEVNEAIKHGLPTERPQLKIEIPANRYDLLCIEGIARALRIFLKKDLPPVYRLSSSISKDMVTVTIASETAKIRPYFAAAILRNVKFTPRSYASFIDLQEKLHQNLARKRTLVAIGTHDLDTVQQPFRYEARRPTDIKFAPLNKKVAYTAEELMKQYESDRHLSRYLPIIKDSPVYPIIYDAQDRVLSMPPIINSEHSKITLNTRNIFIDTTAVDETKLSIVINMVALMFSEYCSEPFTVEPVRVIYPGGREVITPDVSSRSMIAHASYINACTGLSLSSAQICSLLQRMTLSAKVSSGDEGVIQLQIPATRPDILHECDVMEDLAIAYGFNNLPRTFPPTNTVAQPLAMNKLSDLVRVEWAMAGWIEVLPLILCSHEENFAWLRRVDDGTEAVHIANPKTLEFQVVRTSLLPGLLKTIRENRSHALPIRIFETSDIVVKDKTSERQARNIRHAAAVWCNKTAGFEITHGLFNRIMDILEIPRIPIGDKTMETGYYLKETDDSTFLPGRAASIYYRESSSRDVKIGVLGILHPNVLQNFEINYPCSALEFNLEPFKK